MIKQMNKVWTRLLGNECLCEGLVATCTPDYNRSARAVLHPPYRYMFYYRTEVRNLLTVPLRIIWFEGFTFADGRWHGKNILNRALTGKDFSAWYSDGEVIVNGVIPPGISAVNNCNWHGSNAPLHTTYKWAYKALDPSGAECYTEVVFERW